MTTEHIEQIFTDYINTKKTQYAILLNGNWGCGKTYFWKHTLEKVAKDSNFDTIYLSLNGVSKIEDLDHQLFIKLIPFISNQENNKIKNATKFLGNALNKLSTHYLKTSLSDIFKGVSIDTFNFSRYIVCFDDLERCQTPVKEVLGFINNLVEHKYLKTVILAHEPEIDKKSGYEIIKEKVIGRDLKFELDIIATLPNLFEKYAKNIAFCTFLMAQKNFITEIFIEYKQYNLRIITFYLDTLERFFPAFEGAEAVYIQEILLFSAIIAIEYKNGGLTSSDYNNFKGIDIIDEHYYSLSIARTIRESEKDQKDKPYAETFYEKYLEKNIQGYFFYPSIYTYVLSGYLNQVELENEIKKRYPEVVPKEIQDFRTLIHYKFRELSNEDFKRMTEDVLQYAKEGKYSIYDYVQIANFFYFFSNEGIIRESKEDIDRVLDDGLNIAKSRKQINDRVLENLLHFEDENSDVTAIKRLVKEIHDEIKKEEYVANSNELIDCLTNKDEFALAEIFEKHKFSKELFQYTDNKSLFDAVLKISNKQLFNFTELLQHRYKISNIGEFLLEDAVCLNKLKTDLFAYTNNNENIEQPRKFLLATLENALMWAVNRLNETRKE